MDNSNPWVPLSQPQQGQEPRPPNQDEIMQWLINQVQQLSLNQQQSQVRPQPQSPFITTRSVEPNASNFKPAKPERFDGAQGKFRAFRRQIFDYLHFLRNTLVTEEDKCMAVGGLMCGKAADWYDGVCASEPEALMDFKVFWSRAETQFDDPY
ncbi:hypothetical protein SeLEV6574_g01935 [Synchytrium endobioticum]|uniref:DUF4939 domain-containing protein n=1 Tax=Synchytrium endobioticum TaxID=286115 RepID=A0A507DAX7_9FUNG|nr:hypothetical protein SeLEV6574_g01935 [Synchytrium endobioticum]